MEEESNDVELATGQADMLALMERNSELLAENNKLLKKIHRGNVLQFWTRMAWYAIIIGLPFILYFYVLEPYFALVGSNYEVFKAGVSEIPGLKGLDVVLDGIFGG